MCDRAVEPEARPGCGSPRIIPSLDGLRAVSIAFVLLSHLSGTRGGLPDLEVLRQLGEFGVRIFFVISGYLITSILLEELGRTGRLALTTFYLRRTLRLFPASYFLIAIVGLLASLNILQLSGRDLAFAATYTMNFHDQRGWPLGHLWSLAIEEQFYLVWPATLALLGMRRASALLIGVVIIAPLFRVASPLLAPWSNFIVWSDALAAGCLLAMWKPTLRPDGFYSRVLASRWFGIVPAVAVAANYVPYTKISQLVCESMMNVAMAMSVDWAMTYNHTTIGRFLNLPAAIRVGILSYSLYLWQQLFLNRASDSAYCVFPLNIVLTFAAAIISFEVIERPFLGLRARLLHAGVGTPHRLRAGPT